jgi:hypothetical protein
MATTAKPATRAPKLRSDNSKAIALVVGLAVASIVLIGVFVYVVMYLK